MGSSKGVAVVLLMALLAIATVREARAQTQDCASKLVPCAGFLNSTKPPESCCQPLRDTIRTERDCLCKLYKSPSFFKTIGINLTEALQLPKNCGISDDVTACKTGSAPSPTASLPPPSQPSPPGGVPRRDNNGTSKTKWIGVSTLLFFWASIIAY